MYFTQSNNTFPFENIITFSFTYNETVNINAPIPITAKALKRPKLINNPLS
jgi:hypothetical protein